MLLELWERALKSRFGVEIGTDNRVLLRQHLYRARVGHPEYDNIVVVVPEQDDQIWLVHKDASGFGTANQSYPKPIHD
jgi:hypothetical protein